MKAAKKTGGGPRETPGVPRGGGRCGPASFITGSAGEGPRFTRPVSSSWRGLNPRFAERPQELPGRVGAAPRSSSSITTTQHTASRCVGRWSSCRGGVVVVRPACGVVARGLADHHHQGGPHEIRTEATVAGHPLGSNSEAKSTRTRLGRIIGRLRPTWCRRIEPSSGRVASAIVLGGITPCGWSTFLLARVTCPSSPKSGTR